MLDSKIHFTASLRQITSVFTLITVFCTTNPTILVFPNSCLEKKQQLKLARRNSQNLKNFKRENSGIVFELTLHFQPGFDTSSVHELFWVQQLVLGMFVYQIFGSLGVRRHVPHAQCYEYKIWLQFRQISFFSELSAPPIPKGLELGMFLGTPEKGSPLKGSISGKCLHKSSGSRILMRLRRV